MKKKLLSIMLSMVFAVSIASTSVFNTKVAKANDSNTYEYNDVLMGTKNLNNTLENSAKLGDTLREPEKGWKRFDDTNRNVEYYTDDGSLREKRTSTIYDGFHQTAQLLCFKQTDSKHGMILRFKFKGTKFRVINHNDYHWAGSKMKVTVDGNEESSNQYVNNVSKEQYRTFNVLSYEKTGMEYGEHTVEIGLDSKSIVPNYDNCPQIKVDAIDIDENGELSVPMELNKSSVNLSIGDTEQLLASLVPDGVAGNKQDWPIKWISNNRDVVKVDQTGKITALKEGKAIVNAIIYDYIYSTHIYAQCEVNVTNEQVVEANSIMLDQNNVWIGNNSSLNLKATVSPSNAINKKVVWTSSNENIATVDQEGNVKSVGYGQVVITAKIENTDIKATCDVEVSEI